MAEADSQQVQVKLPKFESETALSENQLIDFCKARGAEAAFTSEADFSIMSDEMQLFIQKLLHYEKSFFSLTVNSDRC